MCCVLLILLGGWGEGASVVGGMRGEMGVGISCPVDI